MESSRRLMLHISYSFREKEWILLTYLLKNQSWVKISASLTNLELSVTTTDTSIVAKYVF